MKKIKLFLIVVIAIMVVGFALPTSAAIPTIVPKCALGDTTPQVSCFLELAVNVSKWILGITGSVALLFFIYGGVILMTSRGNEQAITKGKDILSKALIGVIIIFGAYVAVSFVWNAFTGKQINTNFDIIEPPKKEKEEKASLPLEEYVCYCVYNEVTVEADLVQKKEAIGSFTNLLTCEQNCKTNCTSQTAPNKTFNYSDGECVTKTSQ
ncbi:pilin [Patescibacteria group bacterium]